MLQEPEISVWCCKTLYYKLQTPLKCRKTEKERRCWEWRKMSSLMLMNELFDEVYAGCLFAWLFSASCSEPLREWYPCAYQDQHVSVLRLQRSHRGCNWSPSEPEWFLPSLIVLRQMEFFWGEYSCKMKEVCVSVEMRHSSITVIGQGSACPTFPVAHQFPVVVQW